MHRYAVKLLIFTIILSAVFALSLLNAGQIPPGKDFNKVRISSSALSLKRTGRYFTIFGGPAYTPDMGLILSMIAGLYDNGERDSEYFEYAPYKNALTIAPTWSSKGMASVLVDWDAPFFSDSMYRVRARSIVSRNLLEHYYGSGKDSMSKLTTPEGRQYKSFNEYNEDILEIENGYTDAYYNYFEEELFLLNLNVERSVFKGLSRITAGFYAAKEWISDYSGRKVPGETAAGDREDAFMNRTKLMDDYLSGEVKGFSGGWENSFRLGFSFDTRDMEINPRKGMFNDIVYMLADRSFGSDFDYTALVAALRYYNAVFKKHADIVIALRALYSVKNGDVPFFNMNYIPTTSRHIYGIGGETSLRGYQQTRFMGPVVSLYNIESRFTLGTFSLGEHNIQMSFVPFADFGKVYDKVEDTDLKDFKTSWGSSFRFDVSQTFILSCDVGFSEEESGLVYVSSGGAF